MALSPDILRRSRDPKYLHLYSKAMRNFRLCSEEFLGYRYSESILNAYEVLEFFWKSIHYLNDGSYPPKHLPDSIDFSRISTLLTSFISSSKISKIRSIFSKYNPSWSANPRQRMQPRYGDEIRGIPPSQLYNFKKTRKAVNDCSTLMFTLALIHRIIQSNHADTNILILNGKVTRSSLEIRCNQFPHANELNVSKWYYMMRKIPDVNIVRKETSQINNAYLIVINPFGESYPEKPSTKLKTPSFDIICDYIFNGGIFVTAGGLPFTYYWDVQQGIQTNANIVVPNIPTHISWRNSGGVPQINIRSTSLLLNNLLQTTFNVMTTMDDPYNRRVGPVSLTLFQNSSDKKYWDCQQVNTNVKEFRSIDPTTSLNAIPIVRVIRYGTEVWPVSIVQYGFGILLHIGVDLTLGNANEKNFVCEAITNLVSNYLRFLN